MLLRDAVASEGDGKPVRKTTLCRTFRLAIYRRYAVGAWPRVQELYKPVAACSVVIRGNEGQYVDVPLVVTIVIPPLMVCAAAGAALLGAPVWATAIACIAGMAIGVEELHRGIRHSCELAQAECLGASATACLVGLFWIATIILLSIAWTKLVRAKRRSASE